MPIGGNASASGSGSTLSSFLARLDTGEAAVLACPLAVFHGRRLVMSMWTKCSNALYSVYCPMMMMVVV